MKRILLFSLIVLSTVSAVNAGENKGLYISGHLVTNQNSKGVANGQTYDNKVNLFDNLSLDVALGYSFGILPWSTGKYTQSIRVEADVLTIALKRNDYDFSDTFGFGISVGAVKGLYDFEFAQIGLTAYAGGGLSHLYINSIFGDNTSYGFNLRGVLGVKYAITNHISLDLQYNCTLPYDKFHGVAASHDSQNIVKLGVIYSF